MNRWATKPLGELCDIEGGNAAPQGDEHFSNGIVPFVRMKDLGRLHFTHNLTQTDDKLTEQSLKANRIRLFEPGCILFPRSGSVALNHRAILGVQAGIVSHIGVVHNLAPEINASYLYFYLTTFDMTALSKKTTGVDSIAFSDVKRIPIPVPPLVEQERIVKLLNEADELRKLRARADSRTADLIPGLFHEMFGDPRLNPRNWPTKQVKQVVRLINGRAFKPTEWGKIGLPIIRIQNLTNSRAPFNFYGGDYEAKHFIRKGALLISWAGQLVSFGVHIWDGADGLLNQHIFRAEPLIDAEQEFLRHALAYVVEQAKSQFHGIEMKHLTKGALEEAEILFPPLPRQQEFAKRVTEIRGLQVNQAASRERLNALFQSMLHRAFRGEL